jgi:hypothetical protein
MLYDKCLNGEPSARVLFPVIHVFLFLQTKKRRRPEQIRRWRRAFSGGDDGHAVLPNHSWAAAPIVDAKKPFSGA